MSRITLCMPERIDAPPPSQQIQRRRSETSHDACAIASVAMGVLMELVSRIQYHPSMLHRFLASCTKPSRVVRRLVRWRWLALNGLPSRVPVATSSTIQLVPTHS